MALNLMNLIGQAVGSQLPVPDEALPPEQNPILVERTLQGLTIVTGKLFRMQYLR